MSQYFSESQLLLVALGFDDLCYLEESQKCDPKDILWTLSMSVTLLQKECTLLYKKLWGAIDQELFRI